MSIKPGDVVQLLDEAGEVTFLRMEGGMAVVRDGHGFEWEVPPGALISLSGNENLGAQLLEVEPVPKEVGKPSPPKPAKEPPRQVEVDLHIHALVDSHARMSNHEMVELQMAHFRQAMSKARAEKTPTLILIHGVGKGVLKAEIRKALAQEERCTFEDANYLQYGYGATEVRLW